jgi:hypothetical protein
MEENFQFLRSEILLKQTIMSRARRKLANINEKKIKLTTIFIISKSFLKKIENLIRLVSKI